MSKVEAVFCRSAPWRGFAGRVVLPWALAGHELHGDGLEIGAGSGAMAEQLLDRTPAVRLAVLDVDPAMQQAASSRLRRFGNRVIAASVGDATQLPYEDESFDFVVSWLMLHHTLQWEAVLAETHRVLRPGGRLIGYDLLDTAPARFIHKIDGSEHRLLSAPDLEATLASNFGSTAVTTALKGLVGRFSAARDAH